MQIIIAGISAENRTEHLPNTDQELFLHHRRLYILEYSISFASTETRTPFPLSSAPGLFAILARLLDSLSGPQYSSPNCGLIA
jgi:hypothetical protein